MRATFTALAVLLIGAVRCLSQDPCIPPGATILAVLPTATVFTGPNGQTARAEWDLINYRTVGGESGYVVDVRTVSFSGDGGVIDGMQTAQIFDGIALESVRRGIAMEYPACPTSCVSPVIVTVWVQSCVRRYDTGTATWFDDCGGGCCKRTYSVCCPNGIAAPVITLVRVESPGCVNVMCQGTCQ